MNTFARQHADQRHASLSITRVATPRGKDVRAAMPPFPRVIGNQNVRALLEGTKQHDEAREGFQKDERACNVDSRAFTGEPLHRVECCGEKDMRGKGEGDELNDRKGAKKGDAKGVKKEPAKVSCTASATGVSLGESGPFDDGTRYGLRTPITIRGTELADVLDSELVATSTNHKGSMAKKPSTTGSTSGFMAADRIPDDHHGSGIADHLSYYDDHGGEGSYSNLQMDLFKIPKCKIDTDQSMPNSGYRITRRVKAEGKKVVGIVTKTAEAVTIGSHKSSKGLTAKKEAKVILRS